MISRKMLLVLLCAAVIGGFYFVESTKPPSESRVIENFNRHRAGFEQLRVMIEADEKLVRVADWGVETTESPIVEIPPKGPFPAARFQQYLSLLSAVGAKVAARMSGPQPEARFVVWGSGFAGETRHVAICWTDKVPANQVTSLDTLYKSPKPRHPVYRHIDGNWYIWADW